MPWRPTARNVPGASSQRYAPTSAALEKSTAKALCKKIRAIRFGGSCPRVNQVRVPRERELQRNAAPIRAAVPK
jgi:hypothetical protein